MKKLKDPLEILVAELEMRSADLLAKSNQFNKTFDKLLEGVQIIDFNWHYVYVNNTLARYENTTKENIVGQSFLKRHPGIEHTPLYQALSHCMVKRKHQQLETELEQADHSKKWFEWSIEPSEEGLLILSLDITKKKLAEEKLNRTNHLFAFISQINQHIVRVNDEATLFRNACRMALEFGRFKVAWIGLFDHANNSVKLVEQSGISTEEVGLFKDFPFQDQGAQRAVLHSGKYYICDDIVNDIEMKAWKAYASKHGICSCIILPIIKAGKIIGTFNLYSRETAPLNHVEIALLVEVTGDISFALNLFEKNETHRITEELVVKNEARFRSLIENSADMVSLVSAAGRLTYISPSVTKLLGYSAKELQNRMESDFIHPDDLPDFNRALTALLKTPGQSFSNEQRVLHKNGNWMWCAGTVTNLLHQPGVQAIVSNFRDITVRKLMERQREFDKDNLNALINNTNDFMWSVDLTHNLITFNNPLQTHIHITTGKAIGIGDDILTVATSDQQQNRFRRFYERAFAGEQVTEIEYTEFPVESWAEVSYYPIRNNNTIIGAACHSRDITTQKSAEKKLSKSEAFTQGILNSLHSHIAVVDTTGNIIATNKLWKKFAMKNRHVTLLNAGVGANYFSACEKFSKEDRSITVDVLKGIKDVISGTLPTFYVEYACHTHTQRRWFAMTVIKFDSKQTLVVVAHQDITERNLAKEQAIAKNEELQQANTELDRFVYSASHDLRAPLCSVLGLVSLVEKDSAETNILEYASLIRSSVNRLDGFIKNILSYSKNNRLAITIGYIPLQQTIEEIVASLRYMKEAEAIQIDMSIDEAQPFYSDIHRFTIVLENLISNAIKFQDYSRAERFIKITAHASVDELQIEIADNGIGIAAEYQPKIFEMFFRISGERVGSGIGLYIVKETITKIHGTLDVVSHEHQGTTFTLRLKNLKPH